MAAEKQARQPSVLIYASGPNGISFPMLKYLHKQGFDVDYTGRVGAGPEPLTWERAKRFNCIVILHHEQGTGNSNRSIGNSKVIQRYLEAGGGVLLAPDMLHWYDRSVLVNWTKAWDEPFGARYLRRQTLHESDAANVQAWAGYFSQRYHYTENIAKHPVTRGVHGVWYPIYQGSNVTKAKVDKLHVSMHPIRPSKEWQVLLRGSDTASTKADVSDWSGDLKGGVLNSAETDASAPPLFAVRGFAEGRMAFFVMHAGYHFMAGMHHCRGGDMESLEGGYALERGFRGKKSDFLRVLVNSLRWLAEPSLAGGRVGGYSQDVAKLDEPVAAPSPVVDWDQRLHIDHFDGMKLKKAAFPQHAVFKGVIGAQTALSGGKGAVADYRKAARQAGLDYVVFLEDFENMTPAKLKQLKQQCAANTDDRILMIPGYHIRDNRGHHMYMFGRKGNGVPWPHQKGLMTEDGKRINNATREEPVSPYCTFVFAGELAHKNQVGYFDLKGSDVTKMWNFRLYSSVALAYYRDGVQREGLDDNFRDFLEVNNQGCNIHPYAVNQVSSPAKLLEAVRSRQMLTHVLAAKLADIGTFGRLRYDYYQPPYVYISNGPRIEAWDALNASCVTHAENYVTPNYRMVVRLRVTSDVGLKEITIWDGVNPCMRILPRGAEVYEKIFEFNHKQMKDLLLDIRDVDGRTAVSGAFYDRIHMHYHQWCGDRMNGLLFHGPLRFPQVLGDTGLNYVPKGMDQFNLYASPGALHTEATLNFASSAGELVLGRLANRPEQTLVSEDVQYFTNRCSMIIAEPERIWSVWGTYGPLAPAELFDLHQRHIAFRNRYARANPYNPSVFGVSAIGDVVPGLNVAEYIFKKDQVLRNIPVTGVSGRGSGGIAGNRWLLALCRSPKHYPVVLDLNDPLLRPKATAFLNRPDAPFKIERGGWFAAYGTGIGTSSRVGYNVGDLPWVARFEEYGIAFLADVEGRAVKAEDRITTKLLSVQGNAPKTVHWDRYMRIADYIGLDGSPGYRLKMLRGRELPVTEGFCDLKAKDGAVEFQLPNPMAGLKLVLPVRVMGMNDKWSAYCYDKVRKQARPIGVHDGVAYARFDPEYHELTHAAVGHPVIADHKGVVILLSVLGDEKYPARDKDGKLFYGGLYRLQVNNPTDKDLTVTLTNNMGLPDFPFQTKKLQIKAGELLDVVTITDPPPRRPKAAPVPVRVQPATDPRGKNLAKNGSFDRGTDGWIALKTVVRENGKRTLVPAPFLSHVADDGVGDRSGCLKVNTRDIGPDGAPWESGAIAHTEGMIPKNSTVRVMFYGKSISGSRRLAVRRHAGGGGTATTLSGEWERYELTFKPGPWETNSLVFSLINPRAGREGQLEAGEFLLDEVTVDLVEEKPRS